MTWFWHLTVHYLDIIRHFLAFSWQPTNWVTNVTGGVVYAVIALIGAALFWPPLRHAIEQFAHGIINKHPLAGELAKVRESLASLHQKHDALHKHVVENLPIKPGE